MHKLPRIKEIDNEVPHPGIGPRGHPKEVRIGDLKTGIDLEAHKEIRNPL
jgi:hypothetical protein